MGKKPVLDLVWILVRVRNFLNERQESDWDWEWEWVLPVVHLSVLDPVVGVGCCPAVVCPLGL